MLKSFVNLWGPAWDEISFPWEKVEKSRKPCLLRDITTPTPLKIPHTDTGCPEEFYFHLFVEMGVQISVESWRKKLIYVPYVPWCSFCLSMGASPKKCHPSEGYLFRHNAPSGRLRQKRWLAGQLQSTNMVTWPSLRSCDQGKQDCINRKSKSLQGLSHYINGH